MGDKRENCSATIVSNLILIQYLDIVMENRFSLVEH